MGATSTRLDYTLSEGQLLRMMPRWRRNEALGGFPMTFVNPITQRAAAWCETTGGPSHKLRPAATFQKID